MHHAEIAGQQIAAPIGNAYVIQQLLESFLDKTIRRHCFGLTLIGDKPVSTCELVNENSNSIDLFPTLKEAKIAANAQNIINNETHFLKIGSRPGSEVITIDLVNKKAIWRIIDKEIDMFRDCFYPEITTQNIYERIMKYPTVMLALNNRHDLMGIVCGMSRESSVVFQRYMELKDNQMSQMAGFDTANPAVEPSAGYRNPQDELDDINKRCKLLTTSGHSPLPIRQFTYRVSSYDNDAEALLAKYARVENELASLYSEGKLDFQALLKKLPA